MVAGLVVTALVLLPISGVNVTDNGAFYLNQAHQILQGQDPGLAPGRVSVRGPVFPLLVVVSFLLGSESVQAAMFVIRFFFAAGVLLSYVLGKYLYGRTVGILVSCLVLSSYGLNMVAGFLDTDIVLPFFVLLFLLLYWLSILRANTLSSFGAGIGLGLAVLLKETAVVFVALPAVLPLFRPEARRKELWTRSLWLYVGLFILVIPWTLWVAIQNGSLKAALGLMHPQIQQSVAEFAGFEHPFTYWLSLFTVRALPAFFSYSQEHLLRATPLAPLIILSWLFLSVRALGRRRESDLVVVISAALFLPIVLRVGDSPARLGQTTIFFYLGYVMTAVTLVALAGFLRAGIERIRASPAWVGKGVIALAVVLPTLFQLPHESSHGVSTRALWVKGGGRLAQ